MKLNITESELPDHLGGHLNRTHTDESTLRYLIKNFKITSMLDIGCGPGGMLDLAKSLHIKATGIDGDWTLDHKKEIFIWDYTEGRFPGPIGNYDLAWSVEFLEHVEEKYIPNYMPDFQRCQYAVITHAPPDWPGHHHVNCQSANYWIEKFSEYGFKFDFDITLQIRKISSMKKGFMQRNGLFFINLKPLTD